MRVLSISLSRNILEEGRERERMRAYASRLGSLSIIVLTRVSHGYAKEVHEGTLHLYPTHARTRIGMLWKACVIALGCMDADRGSDWVLTAQDPLEIGWTAWFISKISGAKLHIQVHGDYWSTDAWVFGSSTRAVRRYLALQLLKHVPAIRAVSKRIRDSLIERGISAKVISVLPIRSELEAFLAVPHTYRADAVLTFLYVGRFAPEKNIPRIVRAFSMLSRTHPEIRLRIVGDGLLREDIELLVKSLDLEARVSVLPWVTDVETEMARADVLLLASHHEAYALTLVEAMAVGLPVITTPVGCVDEVVCDGVQGIVVRDQSDMAYALAMERYLNDPTLARRHGVAGKQTAGVMGKVSPGEYADAWVTDITRTLEGV